MIINSIKRFLLPTMLTCAMQVNAQDILVVNPEFKITPNYEFNQEWHYLTSELYLFNATKFSDVVNSLYTGLSKKVKNTLPSPENILITARIDGTALGNMSYPIFNFNINYENNIAKTYTTDTYEAIRIMDNLPLSAMNKGRIDCNINIELITNDQPNKIFEFVAGQLTQISNFSTPLSATKTLVGELGTLITSKSNKKEYKFSSTIRLYEEDDFSKRIASINIYTFVPSQNSGTNVDTTNIFNYINSSDNPKLDRRKISQLIRCNNFPYMVIVNYKSKYSSEPVVGDEITTETVESRLNKVKKAYESGLLSADIYTQELKLVDFLKEFVTLKQNISSYNLNSKNEITNDFSVQFKQIFDNYITIKKTLENRKVEYNNNPIFTNEFLSSYQSIVSNAEMYLEADNNLRNIKNIAKILLKKENENSQKTFDAKSNEQILATLHSVKFPQEYSEGSELDNLHTLINKLEKEQNQKVFLAKCNKLNTMPLGPEATAYCEQLREEMNSTNCRLCRENTTLAINNYMQKLDAENLRIAKIKLDNSIANAKDQVFATLQKEKIIKKHFEEDYGEQLPEDVEYIHEDFIKMQKNRENLQNIIKTDYSKQNTTQLNLISDDIEYETKDLAKNLEQICKKIPELCE